MRSQPRRHALPAPPPPQAQAAPAGPAARVEGCGRPPHAAEAAAAEEEEEEEEEEEAAAAAAIRIGAGESAHRGGRGALHVASAVVARDPPAVGVGGRRLRTAPLRIA
jgi:hypothetical protein